MINKKWLIPIAIIILIATLWFSGFVPKQIARISGTNYVKEHFPEMQLEYLNVEYAKVYGAYLISFKDKDENIYSCVISSSILPISLGQGLFVIEEYYAEHY